MDLIIFIPLVMLILAVVLIISAYVLAAVAVGADSEVAAIIGVFCTGIGAILMPISIILLIIGVVWTVFA